jgi:imidazole glycerol phosphate synthase glutamine amidotransferase subunit
VLIDSGVANLASIVSALHAVGAEVEVTGDPARLASASHLVLPGVGHFDAGLDRLRQRGLDSAIHRAIVAGKPFLAICLGLQMLCSGSEESSGTAGLGIVDASCRSLPTAVRVPHLGWNGIDPDPRCRLLAAGDAAFANSFALTEAPSGWYAAWSNHGGRFVAALERGRTLACQFHPELSGAWGLDLLRRWLHDTPATSAGAPASSAITRRIIPCLDVKHGRVVKGIQFQQIRDAGDPAERAALYESQGADEIVLLDIAASPEKLDTHLETVRRVRAQLRIPLSVGGGVRSPEDARQLLAAGADKVAINTAAVRRPQLLTELAQRFGSQCVVLAIDGRRANGNSPADPRWEVLVKGGREAVDREVVAWARQGVEAGAGEILMTSWDRDGTRSGCDLELLGVVTDEVNVPVIASGGIGTRQHVADALAAGADAVLAASIFHDNEKSVREIKSFLDEEGYSVRR